jgi:hypothetical protein
MKHKDLIKRLTMKDYGDTPLGALDAMADAAKLIQQMMDMIAELKIDVRNLENELMEMKCDR